MFPFAILKKSKMLSNLSIPPTKRFLQKPSILQARLFAMLCAFYPNFVASTCDLVPYSSSSCMNLVSRPRLTASTSPFGQYIEGTSTDKRGNMFAVNYGNSTTLNTMGQFYPTTRLFYTDPLIQSQIHGMRFLNESVAYVVDSANHRVLELRVAAQERKSPSGNHPVVVASSIYCENPSMLEPNDLTLSKSGTVFTSGMSPLSPTDPGMGHVWSCTQNGEIRLLDVMGRTNGIDLSPDDGLLYVSEFFTSGGIPVTEKIWVYDVQAEEGRISGKRLFVDFSSFDSKTRVIDGMKTDVAGNLWVTRYGGAEVVVLNQCGKLIARMAVSFTNPTNLEFGGENGTTLFIVGKCDGADAGCIDSLQVVNPGRSWTNLQ